MATRTKRAADAIDKRRPRRQHIILQTLPPVVFSTPTNTISIRLAMSTASVKSDTLSLGSAPSARSSLQSSQSAQAQDPVGDGKHSPSLSDIVSTDMVKTSVLTQAINSLHARIDQRDASLRQELQVAKDELRAETKQQGDRLEAKIDHALEHDLPLQFLAVHNRLDHVEKSMQSLEKSMRDEMNSMRNEIMQMLQQIQQGVQVHPLIVEQPPSPTLEFASDASERSAAGPSSPRHHQGLSAEARADRDSVSSSTRKLEGVLRRIHGITFGALNRKKSASQ
ncbi:hypothetical protein L227DRAFT_600293 [Lentinus tigrinus ALCF2SS1-6]|uniref:Uncharacterized protein n=1 Tax=Lentinus tigrinus ALCF2SS1-6 TaxID=1328759 RepID=A0A5C2SDI5_9APHY|nr:hypothetical protein L227DRAFT_600293 [Lentinus tigrinus ALCF2SS1-6]